VPQDVLVLLRLKLLGVRDRHELAVDADQRLGRDLEMEVGALLLDERVQGSVDVEHRRCIGMRCGDLEAASPVRPRGRGCGRGGERPRTVT